MNDLQLLHFAARAAGHALSLEWDCAAHGIFIGTGRGDLQTWDPLTDDGDALRLAVKLRLGIEHNHPWDSVQWVQVSNAVGTNLVFEEFDDYPEAATRRAIVRAAAEIGRTTP